MDTFILEVELLKSIGIIGTRRRNSIQDEFKVRAAFNAIYKEGDTIVSGGCPQGGDRFAEYIAKKEQVPILIHYARWKQYGKAAGFIRNGDIAGDADVLIACVASDRTGGTEDTIIKFLQINKLTEQEAIEKGLLILP